MKKNCPLCKNGKKMPKPEKCRIEVDEFDAIVYCGRCNRLLQA